MTNKLNHDHIETPWTKFYTPSQKNYKPHSPFSSLAEMATKTAATYGRSTAFTCCLDNGLQGRLSFKSVDVLSDHFASFLTEDLGLHRGDRVAVQMPNCLAYPVVAFGIFKAGCVLVNTNPLYTEREMEHQFNDSGAKALVMIDLFADKLTEVLPKTGIQHVVLTSVADFFPMPIRALVGTVLKLKKKIPPVRVHHTSLNRALGLGKSRVNAFRAKKIAAQLDANALAVLQYTGGTTGVAKGAMLSHSNILCNISQTLLFAGKKIEPGEETILTALPLYHVFAFTVNFLTFFSIGGHNVLCPSPRPISNLRKCFEKHKISWITGVNTLYSALMNEPWFMLNPPKTMKLAGAGGAALHEAVAKKWERMVGTKLIEGFGLSETSPILAFNPMDGRDRINSIGIPLPGTQLALVDDNDQMQPQGSPGELVAKGPQVMLGYWNKPEETEKVMKNGWFYTGDIAVMDADGFFRIVDRKKDMILVSGFNVYPNEVEDCLAKHEHVAEVAVIGVPDEKCGEAVIAYVVPKSPDASADALRAHCKDLLAGYKVPKRIEFRKDLPKTPIGKILRKELRKEVLQQS